MALVNYEMQTDIPLNVPCIISADDYHEFGFINSVVKSLNPKLKCSEVGFYGEYLGVIYYGKKPTKAQLRELIGIYGYNIEDEQ